MMTATTHDGGKGDDVDDDGWPTTRQDRTGGPKGITYLRFRPSAADEDDVHVALLGGDTEPRTLCDRPVDLAAVEVVDDLGDKPCLRCVARAAELTCADADGAR